MLESLLFFFYSISHWCLWMWHDEVNFKVVSWDTEGRCPQSVGKLVIWGLARSAVCHSSSAWSRRVRQGFQEEESKQAEFLVWENPPHLLAKLSISSLGCFSLLFLTFSRLARVVLSWCCGCSLLSTTRCGFAGYRPALVAICGSVHEGSFTCMCGQCPWANWRFHFIVRKGWSPLGK